MTRTTPLERPLGFILVFTDDAHTHRQLLHNQIPRKGVNPSSHWPAIEQTGALRARSGLTKEVKVTVENGKEVMALFF
jgi:hypothetical protein